MKLDEHDQSQLETTARVHQWKWMTGEEIDALDRNNTIAVISCSPLEVHGPHLPTVTDRLESRAIALRIMELLCDLHPELQFVEVPALYVATDVLPQPGSINFRTSTIISVIEDLGRSLCAQGFKRIWVSNFHGGPRHWVSLEVAADRVNRLYGGQMLSLFSMLIGDLNNGRTEGVDLLAGIEGVDPDWLEGDMHAGLLETALMLHLVRDKVRPHQHLPQFTLSKEVRNMGMEDDQGGFGLGRIARLLKGFEYTIRYYERETYAGYPGVATPEMGEAFLNRLAQLSVDSLNDVIAGHRPLNACHSPLWPLRHLLTSELVVKLFYKWVGHRSQVF